MDWSLLGTLINDSSATPCQCLICGHGFYFDPDLMENVACIATISFPVWRQLEFPVGRMV